MCSSWYHLRYLSPHYDKGPFDEAEYNYWMPVDTYTGGIEHATMHLLYTRFFHKALRDAGITEGNEPMMQLRNQGMVLGEDNEKMSKSRGNVIAPDVLVNQYGADTVRAYLMFFARWEMGAPWDSQGHRRNCALDPPRLDSVHRSDVSPALPQRRNETDSAPQGPPDPAPSDP